jgi:hypothetical protein
MFNDSLTCNAWEENSSEENVELNFRIEINCTVIWFLEIYYIGTTLKTKNKSLMREN